MFFGFDVRVPPKIRSYLKNNPGAPFIIGFQALLLICAGLFILGNAELANGVATGAYFSLFIGVILQLIHFVTHGKEAGECDYGKDD